MSNRSFKELFCVRVGCAMEDYERVALRRCCYPHAVRLLGFLAMIGTDGLALSKEVLEEAGKATTADEFREAVRDFRLAITDGSVVFDFKLRLSSTKLLKWVELFPDYDKQEVDVFDTDMAVRPGLCRMPNERTDAADPEQA